MRLFVDQVVHLIYLVNNQSLLVRDRLSHDYPTSFAILLVLLVSPFFLFTIYHFYVLCEWIF